MASPGSSVGGFAACGTMPGVTRHDPQVSRFTFCRPSGCFQNSLSVTESGLLAGVASGCSVLSGIVYCLPGPEVSVPTEGAHGAC